MKRYNDTDIIPKVIARPNFETAVTTVLRGSDRKESKQGRYILENKDDVYNRLVAEISAGTFCLTSFKDMDVIEGGKHRKVQCLLEYRERIGVAMIMAVIEDVTYRRFIRTTAASIKRRGVHDLLNVIRRDLAEDPDAMRFVYADDISKFYESIEQDFMMFCLRRMFKGPILLTMLERFVRLMPNGLSIGLRSSQFYGNLILSMFLDHFLKSQHRTKHYYRYCDDKRIIAATKAELWEARALVYERVAFMGLRVKPNDRIFPITDGVDFLGYVIFPDHTRIRKRNKKNAARRLKKIKSKTRRQEILASFYSLCKHADAKHLFYKITGIRMSDFTNLKSLDELGIAPSHNQGQKKFRCQEFTLNALVGSVISILDFVPDVSTKFSRLELKKARESGEPNPVEKTKYLICARIIVPNKTQMAACGRQAKKGDVVKFFTGFSDMWEVCNKLRAANLLEANKVTIAKSATGNFTEYYFT